MTQEFICLRVTKDNIVALICKQLIPQKEYITQLQVDKYGALYLLIDLMILLDMLKWKRIAFHFIVLVFQHGTCKSTKSCVEENIKSKMSRASSLPSTNKTHHQQSSSSSVSSHRANVPTQAEVVKNRILKTETENQIMQELIRNNGGHMNQLKVENEEENPESPFVDVEALSDGDEKVECETGKKTKKTSNSYFYLSYNS